MELITVLRDIRRRMLGPPKPGSAAYRRQVSEEIQHYSQMHLEAAQADARLCEPTPPVWEEIQNRCVERIRSRTGTDIIGHAVTRLAGRPGARLISLGSGPGGVELAIAREARQADFLCLDLNPAILELGREQARREDLPVTFQQADLNTAELPEAAFDVALCYASLHHLIALEHVVGQMRRCLRPGGELIVMDVITRNGFRMWPETKRVAEAIWDTLPARYRVSHSTPGTPRLDSRLWCGDTRRTGMECVRSEEILPLLRGGFREVASVPLLSLATRFLNTMYGPNYDLEQPLDRAIMDWIWELDLHMLDTGQLRPESLFGIYTPR
ncbi:MAG: class I SAM-dependent methyltransferase [Acidobacteriia bacterium]|nr:class I SAM-dependent methyltransferase [Terriglobia bacterium]